MQARCVPGPGVRGHAPPKRWFCSQGVLTMAYSRIGTASSGLTLNAGPRPVDVRRGITNSKWSKPSLNVFLSSGCFFSPIFPLSRVKHLTLESVCLITPHEFPGGLLLAGSSLSSTRAGIRGGGLGVPGAYQLTGEEERDRGRA